MTIPLLGIVVGGFCVLPEIWDRFKTEDNTALLAAATEFGKHTDYQGCEDQAVGRMERCTERAVREAVEVSRRHARESMLDCGAEVVLFHDSCLRAAEPSEGFCERPVEERLSNEDWVIKHCKMGRQRLPPDPGCVAVLEVSMNHCETRAED